MKTLNLFLLFFTVLFANAENVKTIVSADIREVKVFLSGAQINRTFRTTVEPGVTQLVIDNLSSRIDVSSISATITGEAMILSTSYSLDYLKEKRQSPELKKLKDSLEILNNDLNELNVLESVYNEEVTLLNSNKSVGGSNVGVNSETLKKVIDFYRSRMTEVKLKVLEIDKKQLKLSDKIKRLNEQIEVENGKVNMPYGTIFVNVSANQNTNVSIDLSYYTQGASWTPAYDLRAKDTKSPVTILYKAMVTQNTGENWEKVKVALSSGNPSLGGSKPNLNPWFLRYADIIKLNSRSSRKDMSEKPAAVYEIQGVEAGGAPAQLSDMVVVQENQIATEFEIQIPYTVMSDGKEVMMEIQSNSLPAEYAYQSVPKIDKDAFLMASITGWEKLSLLPGNANIYLENSYVGESFINPVNASDTLQLSFGRDKRISIKRERIIDNNSSKFISGNVEKDFLYETTIRNTKKENITLTIEDQVPLKTDESMKISTTELSAGNYVEETGKISWKIELKPGETKKIRFGFKVKYPKDRYIPGL